MVAIAGDMDMDRRSGRLSVRGKDLVSMNVEHRSGVEFRVAGRTLSGVAMRYGDISPDFRERFQPGAFGEVPIVIPINVQHDPAMIAADSAILIDSPRELRVRADLPEGSAALKLVRRGVLNGFSVEFHAETERREAGVRVIERAKLSGLALVDRGAYPGSTAEVRARGSRGGRLDTLRGRIPAGKKLACRCSPGSCTEAIFEAGSLDGAATKDEILAIVGEYSDAVASKKRGGVRMWTGTNGDLEFAVDIPNTARGQALVDTMKSAPVYGRPYVDVDASDLTITDDVASYQRAEIRAITIGPTDANDGWPELRSRTGPDDDVPKSTADKIKALSGIAKRRAALWL